MLEEISVFLFGMASRARSLLAFVSVSKTAKFHRLYLGDQLGGAGMCECVCTCHPWIRALLRQTY